MVGVGILAAALVTRDATAANAWFERQPYLQWDSETSRIVFAGPHDTSRTWRVRLQSALSGPDVNGVVVNMQTDGESGLMKATLGNLEPNRKYRYRVETDKEVDSWSSFVMPPLAGDKTAFRFVAYGDTRTLTTAHAQVAEAIAREPDLAFILHVGDLTENGNEKECWEREFFTPAAGMLRSAMLLPCLGNHDEHSQFYFNNFNLPRNPGNEAYYSLDFGKVHLIVIDQFQDYDGQSVQGRWIAKDLAGVPPDRWKVAHFHKPPFASYESDGDGVNMKVAEWLCPVFEKYGVDVIFAGHNHCYLRTCPIGTVGRKSPVYVITGGGGAPLDNPYQGAIVKSSYKGLQYCLVTVTPDQFTITAKDSGGKVIDQFTLRKNEIPTNSQDRQAIVASALKGWNGR
ncbi:MAG: metallophosphoesterase family protein [bacterium]